MANNIDSTPLAALGFSETEALVYCELLREPATGYRLAQALGKSPPNIYHALGALREKGAILIDDSEGRVCRAVSPDELLAGLARQFEARREQARAALAAVESKAEDSRVYHLRTVEQVIGRARQMIADAREILLFDCFPGPFAVLCDDFAEAAARGVTVAGLVYEAVDAPGLRLVHLSPPPDIMARWPGEQLGLVADAKEYLLALLSHDGREARHALWSGGAYLSALQHNALASEIRLTALAPAAGEDGFADIALLRAVPPGLRTLIGAEA